MKIVLLGASGMLGHMVLEILTKAKNPKTDEFFDIMAVARTFPNVDLKKNKKQKSVEYKILDVEDDNSNDLFDQLFATLHSGDWIINCIGLIKQNLKDNSAQTVKKALKINSLFPCILAEAAEQKSCRVLQIATDCVFSGQRGNYLEKDKHDADDLYGKTKSLGEIKSDHFFNLRTSIIGPEQKGHVSLLEWFLNRPQGAQLKGYTNHFWNGMTTLHFAKICLGMIDQSMTLPSLQHMVPQDYVSKFELLKLFQVYFNRPDIIINPCEAPESINRTLATHNKTLNNQLWQMAGYNSPPTIDNMVKELAHYLKAEQSL